MRDNFVGVLFFILPKDAQVDQICVHLSCAQISSNACRNGGVSDRGFVPLPPLVSSILPSSSVVVESSCQLISPFQISIFRRAHGRARIASTLPGCVRALFRCQVGLASLPLKHRLMTAKMLRRSCWPTRFSLDVFVASSTTISVACS